MALEPRESNLGEMMLTVYGLKTCDTCRKARKALEGAGHKIQFIDVRADGLPIEILRAALAEFGDALLNKKSTTWRGLSDTDKERDAEALIVDHPTLMKRPLIVRGDVMTIGWSNSVQIAYV